VSTVADRPVETPVPSVRSSAVEERAPVARVFPAARVSPPTPTPAPTRVPRVAPVSRVRAYLALTKPRIVELLLVTTVPAMVLAQRGVPSWRLLVAVLVGGSLAAGAANALNCYIDRDIDEVMQRTARRPLPAHTVTPRAALVFGLSLAVIATTLMAALTTWLATGLTVAAVAYYDLVYTLWLKRTTSQNTVWGGICGAMPVLIGWAAVTGSLAWPAWSMFAIVFFWQPPHFYALAVKFRHDYARAGVPMLPVVASPRRVAGETVVYCWLTVAASLALWPLAMTWVYGVAAGVLGAALLTEAHAMQGRIRRGEPTNPMRLFHWSTTYLTVVFVAIAVDVLVRS
jgi:heme o synthase